MVLLKSRKELCVCPRLVPLTAIVCCDAERDKFHARIEQARVIYEKISGSPLVPAATNAT